MFKQPAGDPAEDFIIYEAAKLEGTSAHEINWNQLKWGWGREGTAHTITCSSNCYYSSLMETLHWKLHTESQWHAGVKTHTGWSVYLKHLDDSWLSRYCLISSTVLYYNHYVHQERQPRVRAHTHTHSTSTFLIITLVVSRFQRRLSKFSSLAFLFKREDREE